MDTSSRIRRKIFLQIHSNAISLLTSIFPPTHFRLNHFCHLSQARRRFSKSNAITRHPRPRIPKMPSK